MNIRKRLLPISMDLRDKALQARGADLENRQRDLAIQREWNKRVRDNIFRRENRRAIPF